MNWKKGDKVEVKVRGRWVEGVIHDHNKWSTCGSMFVEIGEGQYRETVGADPEWIRMRRNSFSSAVRKAYRFSAQYQLDKLLVECRKWQRRQTIATTKLADAQKALDEMLNTLVKSEMEKGKQNE